MNEEDYQYIKRLFLSSIKEEEGPHRLTIKGLSALYIKKHLSNDNERAIELTVEVLEPIWLRLVTELCPIQIEIDQNFNVVEQVSLIDDNTDYVFCTAHTAPDRKTRILRISNPIIAAMIQIRGQR